MTAILVLADYVHTMELAARLVPGARSAGDKIKVLTPRLSLYLTGRMRGLDIDLLKRGPLNAPAINRMNSNTFEERTGYITPGDARALYEAFVENGYKLLSRNPEEWSLILCWNGAHISSRAAAALSETFKIPLLHMEIANLPGRMLVECGRLRLRCSGRKKSLNT